MRGKGGKSESQRFVCENVTSLRVVSGLPKQSNNPLLVVSITSEQSESVGRTGSRNKNTVN